MILILLNSLLSVCGKNSEPQVSPSDLRRSAEQWKWLHSFCLPSCWTLSHHSHATAVRWLLSSQCGDHVGATRMFIKELLTWRQAQVSREACELSLVFIGNSISQQHFVIVGPWSAQAHETCQNSPPRLLNTWMKEQVDDKRAVFSSLFRSRTSPWQAIHALASVLCLANSS